MVNRDGGLTRIVSNFTNRLTADEILGVAITRITLGIC